MSLIDLLFGAKSKVSDKVKILDANDFSQAISGPRAQLVDVRTANEFNSGHIKGALNIDFFGWAKFEKEIDKLDKDRPLYLYCRSGARSQKAARKFVDMGFSEIYDLKGGYLSWKN